MTTYVDPWLAGKANLVQAKANGKVAEINAKAEAEARREDRKADRADKKRERRARKITAAWAAARSSWYEALWLPVIVAPAVLAWKGQTAAGDAVYGDASGWLLALFTETAAWVVSFYVTAAARRNPNMPVGRGRVAVWLVALAAAVMNYLHGAQTSWWHGVVMGVVSIGGIALHQVAQSLRTQSESGVSGAQLRAGAARWLLHPLWSIRAASIAAARGIDHGEAFAALWRDHWGTDAIGRRERRRARAAQARVADLERAAASSATAWLRPDGRVELRYPEGPVTLRRGFHRGRLTATTGVSVADELARLLAAAPVSGRVVPLWAGTGRTTPHTGVAPHRNSANPPEPAGNSANPPEPAGNSANAPTPAGNSGNGDVDPVLVRQVQDAIDAGRLPERPSRSEIQKHLRVRAAVAIAVKAALHDGNSANAAGVA